MEKQQLQQLGKFIKDKYDKCGLDFKTFDVSQIDDKLSYEENLKKVEPILPKTKEEIQAIEEQADKEFNRILDKIGDEKSNDTINDVYFIPKQYTKMVANGFARGFLLYGEAGLGKTYSVMKAFKEADKKFVMLSGHITALELYHFLFEHRADNIVLDDVNILETEQNLNMLKACLSDNSRVVSYHTSSSRLRVPNKFVFEGTIILLLNKIPHQAESLKAVESRILCYELKLDYKTKIQIIFELIKEDYKDISEYDRLMIAKWIKENTNEATENLNLRLLFLCYEFYRFDKENWIRLATKTLKIDTLIQLVVQGLSQQEWCDKTGMSRRSFYLYKEKCKSAIKKGYEN